MKQFHSFFVPGSRSPGRDRSAPAARADRAPVFEPLEARLLLSHGQPHHPLTDHIHADLAILIEGQQVEIPAHLGVDQGGIVSFVHTHSADNRLHIHPINGQVAPRYTSVGDVFETWRTNAGVARNRPDAIFNERQIFDRLVDEHYVLQMQVNGSLSDAFGDYLISDGDDIVIRFDQIQRPDLVVAVGPAKLPGQLVSGDRTRIVLPLVVTNSGTGTLAAGQRIAIEVWARPVAVPDGSADVLVGQVANQLVSRLGSGRSKTARIPVNFDASVPPGRYGLVATVDTTQLVSEWDETNNSGATDAGQTIDVAQGFIDLAPTFDRITLPPAIVAGSATKGRVHVNLANEGNVALAKGQKIGLVIAARPVDGGDDVVLLDLAGQSVSGLKPGKLKRITANVTIPGSAPSGNYRLTVLIDQTDLVAESDEQNNRIITVPITSVAAPFVDLILAIGAAKLPARIVSGDGTKIRLPVLITNGGNVALPKGAVVGLDPCDRHCAWTEREP